MPIPTQNEIKMPLLEVIERLGGKATPQQIYPIVAKYFPQLTHEDLTATVPNYPSTKKWWNRVQWTRQSLVEAGLIDGTELGIWKITEKGREELHSHPPNRSASIATTENNTIQESPKATSLFSQKTFELLAALTTTPTVAFYERRQNEFEAEVEDPMRRLFELVREQMPQQILDVLETEKRILAQIRKNDYGAGGTHNYLWGAFYAKGGKRTESAQLFVTITRDALEVGFYIGDYGKAQRERFAKNSQLHLKELAAKFEADFAAASVRYGARRPDVIPPGFVQPQNFTEWAMRGQETQPSVRVFLSKDEIMSMPLADLITKVSSLFVMFFPLVFVALHDNPLPFIEGFSNQPSESSVPEASDEVANLTINPQFSLDDCARETGCSTDQLNQWLRGIHRKKQAIIYGPPGTGKTFIAENLAKYLIGGGDGFCDLVQFHPAYSYEDFIQGIRPKSTSIGTLSYPLVPGRFLEFCGKAQGSSGTCVLIIDEINRANLARVFGELMYLLEYRNRKITLAGGTPFQIPDNVRLIGTMNTADRSIALVDHALRRRFAFIELAPQYNVLEKFHELTGFSTGGLIQVLKGLNNIINDKNYHVGISFFLRTDLKNEIEGIWKLEIEPYLEEFFFDQHEKLEPFRWEKIQQKVLA